MRCTTSAARPAPAGRATRSPRIPGASRRATHAGPLRSPRRPRTHRQARHRSGTPRDRETAASRSGSSRRAAAAYAPEGLHQCGAQHWPRAAGAPGRATRSPPNTRGCGEKWTTVVPKLDTPQNAATQRPRQGPPSPRRAARWPGDKRPCPSGTPRARAASLERRLRKTMPVWRRSRRAAVRGAYSPGIRLEPATPALLPLAAAVGERTGSHGTGAERHELAKRPH